VDPFAEQDVAADHTDVTGSLFDGFIDHLQKHNASKELVKCWTNNNAD
jgi:hypothetical protein